MFAMSGHIQEEASLRPHDHSVGLVQQNRPNAATRVPVVKRR